MTGSAEPDPVTFWMMVTGVDQASMPKSRSPHSNATVKMAYQAAVLAADHVSRYPECSLIAACADRAWRQIRNRCPTWREDGSSNSVRVRAQLGLVAVTCPSAAS